MNIYSFSVLCFSFGVFLTAILALQKRRDEIAWRFFLFSISVCGWGFLFSLWITQAYSAEMTLRIIRFSYLFVVFIPVAWLHFSLEFIGEREPFQFFYVTNYAAAFYLALLCPTQFMFTGLHSILGFKYSPTPGIAHHFHVFLFYAYTGYGLWRLIRAWSKAEGAEKLRLKNFTLGALIGFSAGGCIYLTFYSVPCPLTGLVLMPLYPILTSIALIRDGMLDEHQVTDAFQREKLAALGMISASLNHELRNPLYVAKGRMESYMDAVDRDLFPSVHEKIEKAEGVMTSALHQLTRAMEIMQRFSDFAKPRSAGFVEKEKVELNETVDDVLKLVSKEFEMKGIKVSEKPEEAISVRANRRQLEEILFNLVVNACHAMGDKGGELAIKANQPNGKVCVEVSDTGAGIAKENQKRIFEPFYTTKAGKGTGLGLYITKQLVERNGGKIAVKSKPGVGTRFILEFQPA